MQLFMQLQKKRVVLRSFSSELRRGLLEAATYWRGGGGGGVIEDWLEPTSAAGDEGVTFWQAALLRREALLREAFPTSLGRIPCPVRDNVTEP
jgi:hypothetical protein